jgi:hypothetical protein
MTWLVALLLLAGPSSKPSPDNMTFAEAIRELNSLLPRLQRGAPPCARGSDFSERIERLACENSASDHGAAFSNCNDKPGVLQKIIDASDPYCVVAAAVARADLIRAYQIYVLRAVLPKNLDPAQADIYQAELRTIAAPLERTATALYSDAIASAEQLDVDSEWVRRARMSLRTSTTSFDWSPRPTECRPGL